MPPDWPSRCSGLPCVPRSSWELWAKRSHSFSGDQLLTCWPYHTWITAKPTFWSSPLTSWAPLRSRSSSCSAQERLVIGLELGREGNRSVFKLPRTFPPHSPSAPPHDYYYSMITIIYEFYCCREIHSPLLLMFPYLWNQASLADLQNSCPVHWSHESYFPTFLAHNLYYQYIGFLQLKAQIVLNCADCVKCILSSPALLILKMCHHSMAILLLIFRLTWSRTACFLLCYIKYQLKEKTKSSSSVKTTSASQHLFHSLDVYRKKERFNIMKHKNPLIWCFSTVLLYSDSIDCIARTEELRLFFSLWKPLTEKDILRLFS